MGKELLGSWAHPHSMGPAWGPLPAARQTPPSLMVEQLSSKARGRVSAEPSHTLGRNRPGPAMPG